MHASSDWKLSTQRLRESLRPLRGAISPDAIRARATRALANPRVERVVHLYAHLTSQARQRIAVVVALVSFAMAVGLGVHFDGVFEVHAPTLGGRSSACFELPFVWALTACALFAAALIARRPGDPTARPTLRDMAIAVGVARMPGVLLAVLVSTFASTPSASAASLLRVLLAVPLILAFAGLLYTGFVAVSGLRSRAAVLPFFGAIVTAEAIAKALLGMP